MLRQAFAGLAGGITLPQGDDALTTLALAAAGALLTVLMQASAATMTLALAAAQGGMIGLQGAAALIIGANIGTTVTALLASIGATPNARRAAAAHLIFNLLGVLLMWPLTRRLTRFLLARFRSAEEDESRPRHLDDNVLAVPELALDALQRELQRIAQVTQRMLRNAAAGAAAAPLARDQVVVGALLRAVATFVERMQGRAMSAACGQRLPQLLSSARYHEAAAEHALEAVQIGLALDDAPAGLLCADAAWRRAVAQMADALEPQGRANLEAALQTMEADYQTFKAALLVWCCTL